MKLYFCPNCHLRIIPPPYLNKIQGGGKIKLNCGNCNKEGKNSKGVITLKMNSSSNGS